MRFLLLLGMIALASVLVSRALRARPGRPPIATPEPAQVTASLRDRALHGSAEEFGIDPAGSVWGVLVDMGYPNGTATLVALADGSASIYFSGGGGVIGGGGHASIATAARRMVDLAAEREQAMAPASDLALPAPGAVRFWVLTREGVVGAEAPEEILGGGDHPLSPLFFASHEVITGLRRVSQEQEDG